MADYARAVGVEALRHASRKCRICKGTGTMHRWAIAGAWRDKEARPEVTICGCAIRRMLAKYPGELTDDDGLLCWKEGFSPKDKQTKELAREADAQNVRP